MVHWYVKLDTNLLNVLFQSITWIARPLSKHLKAGLIMWVVLKVVTLILRGKNIQILKFTTNETTTLH